MVYQPTLTQKFVRESLDISWEAVLPFEQGSNQWPSICYHNTEELDNYEVVCDVSMFYDPNGNTTYWKSM